MRLSLLLVFVLAVGQVQAEEAGDFASFLISSQNADGSFGSTDRGPESQVYTTAKALEGLIYHGEESGDVLDGVEWIEIQDPGDTAALAEVIKVLRLSGHDTAPHVSKLKNYQNADGGWGKTAGFESTPWYTSSAIISLGPLEEGLDGGEYLLGVQGESGGFEGSALITSNCVYALVILYDATKRDEFAIAAARGVSWLNENREADGSWGSATSTGNAVVALGAFYGLSGDEEVKALRDNASIWIMDLVKNEGDVLSTAWALAALTLEVDVSPAVSKPKIHAKLTNDFVFPSDSTQIKFEIANEGLGILKNISLLLVVPEELDVEIENTSFEIDILKTGEKKEFTKDIYLGDDTGKGEYVLAIKGDSFSSSVMLRVLESPFVFTISPTELKNDAPTDFNIKIINRGEMDFTIKSISGEFDEKWKDVESESVKLELPAGSGNSALFFSAIAPEESGEYNVPITVEFASSELGEKQISFKQKFLIGTGVPSGVLKLVLYGTLVLSVMMLLNLLIGYDLLG
jgi:hypothetical protein